MTKRPLNILVLATLLVGILIDRILVNWFGAEHINWFGLILGCAINIWVAGIAYTRANGPTSRTEERSQ